MAITRQTNVRPRSDDLLALEPSPVDEHAVDAAVGTIGGAYVSVNGENLFATVCGALFWPRKSALIFADLHFEKGSSFAPRGLYLPPYDTRTTLRRAGQLVRAFLPTLVVSLGDAFHDAGALARMAREDAQRLSSLVRDRRWVWVLGNHDPHPPSNIAGDALSELRMDGLVFRHEPRLDDAAGEIAGHLHPCARISVEGRRIRRRCFATDGARLIMPAYGAYAGGLNLLDPAFDGLFGEATALVLGAKGVYRFDRQRLMADPGRSRRC